MCAENLFSETDQYTLINKDNAVIHNYIEEYDHADPDLYISPNRELWIIGELDNNYMMTASRQRVQQV